MEGTIVNKVAQSKLITLDVEQYIPNPSEILVVDVAYGLYEGLILKEKEFRSWVKEIQPADSIQFVQVKNSSEGIIPNWAFMLLLAHFNQLNIPSVYSDDQTALESFIQAKIKAQFIKTLADGAKVVLKGCGKVALSPSFYHDITQLLIPKCSSIMYGEPCSTVPIFKAQKKP